MACFALSPVVVCSCAAVSAVGYTIYNLPSFYDDGVLASALCGSTLFAADCAACFDDAVEVLAELPQFPDPFEIYHASPSASQADLFEPFRESRLLDKDTIRSTRGCLDLLHFVDCFPDYTRSNYFNAWVYVERMREIFADCGLGVYAGEPNGVVRTLGWLFDICGYHPHPAVSTSGYDRLMLDGLVGFENKVRTLSQRCELDVWSFSHEHFRTAYDMMTSGDGSIKVSSTRGPRRARTIAELLFTH